MVLLMAGYPLTFPDAKAWALRNWPDMNIYDDEELPLIIARYHRNRRGKMTCLPLEVNEELMVFFVINSKEDPLSTPFKYRQLPESEVALKCKTLLFRHDGDKELAEKTKWTTLVDPYHEWSRSNSRRKPHSEAEAEAAPQS